MPYHDQQAKPQVTAPHRVLERYTLLAFRTHSGTPHDQRVHARRLTPEEPQVSSRILFSSGTGSETQRASARSHPIRRISLDGPGLCGTSRSGAVGAQARSATSCSRCMTGGAASGSRRRWVHSTGLACVALPEHVPPFQLEAVDRDSRRLDLVDGVDAAGGRVEQEVGAGRRGERRDRPRQVGEASLDQRAAAVDLLDQVGVPERGDVVPRAIGVGGLLAGVGSVARHRGLRPLGGGHVVASDTPLDRPEEVGVFVGAEVDLVDNGAGERGGDRRPDARDRVQSGDGEERPAVGWRVSVQSSSKGRDPRLADGGDVSGPPRNREGEPVVSVSLTISSSRSVAKCLRSGA